MIATVILTKDLYISSKIRLNCTISWNKFAVSQSSRSYVHDRSNHDRWIMSPMHLQRCGYGQCELTKIKKEIYELGHWSSWRCINNHWHPTWYVSIIVKGGSTFFHINNEMGGGQDGKINGGQEVCFLYGFSFIFFVY